ncbi:serine hydrolase domain-containing protein [Perlabentimonas gracilis]|uniref:serine hydrolase domain-containing protein n=1 Tax=Perlabentimonas gracilis TaxID=2715279 RepID=UPI00140A7A9B|nr:serine hydrolase domain-containing protein [Perlabentimonas gracilis]NHB67152.1 beta-lactamase family protein [Perlabentimonas gracilis]
MNTKLNETFLNQTVEKMVKSKKVFSAALCVEDGSGTFAWHGAAGEMGKDDTYFIASVTKLYVTIVVQRLIDEQKLSLDDKIAKYLPAEMVKGLHILKGTDYSNQITIRHLISNTSGIPDYFFHKQPSGKTAADELLAGKDEAWDLDKTIGLIKNLKPNFMPGKKGKANYSDTNYQILGRIIEIVTGKAIGEVFREYIFEPLGLRNTYAYSDTSDDTPTKFYYRNKELWIPRYMASVTVEGGIVSTSKEVMAVIKAFFNGTFFPKERINELKQWNLLFGPGIFYFGVGLEKLFVPRIASPFKPIGEVLGFWGQTGSFAFYNPKTDLYFTGTTNQINGAGHQAAGSAMNKIIRKAL